MLVRRIRVIYWIRTIKNKVYKPKYAPIIAQKTEINPIKHADI